MREYLLKRIISLHDDQYLALIYALVFGIELNRSNELRHIFLVTGTLHLLVFSGSNLNKVNSIFDLLNKRLSYSLSKILQILLVFVYFLLLPENILIQRAFIMFIFYQVAVIFHRQIYSFLLLLITIIILFLIYSKEMFFSKSFQLSVTAFLTIQLLHITKKSLSLSFDFLRSKIIKRLFSCFYREIVFQLLFCPFIFFFFGQYPLLTIFFTLIISYFIDSFFNFFFLTIFLSLFIGHDLVLFKPILMLFFSIINFFVKLSDKLTIYCQFQLIHVLIYYFFLILLLFNKKKIELSQFFYD